MKGGPWASYSINGGLFSRKATDDTPDLRPGLLLCGRGLVGGASVNEGWDVGQEGAGGLPEWRVSLLIFVSLKNDTQACRCGPSEGGGDEGRPRAPAGTGGGLAFAERLPNEG